MATLPDIEENLGSKKNALDTLQSTVSTLTEKLSSRWYRFCSFAWLESGKLAKEQEQHSEGIRALPCVQQAYEAASKLHDELLGAQRHLSGFTKTSEGFVALTATGRSFVEEFEAKSFERLFEVRSAYKTGIAGVWNPKTGQVEWNSSYMTGVAGVWNPKTEQVEWQSSYKTGVAGVWNPKTDQVEWKSSYMTGVAGVWNPKTEQVEWQSSYKGGVAGVWNPETEKVVWRSSYKTGLAIVPRSGRHLLRTPSTHTSREALFGH